MLDQPKLPGILILLVYYNRPILVKNALNSILESHFDNYHLAVLDDGSDHPAEPIVRGMFPIDQVSFYRSEVTLEDKIQSGMTVGKLANQAIIDSEMSICITLCDDDELHPLYLRNISKFFRRRNEVFYCYSNIYLYNPLNQQSKDIITLSGPYNDWTEPIECYGKVDGSQVAFRTSCMKKDGIWWNETTKEKDAPFSGNLDGELFKQFYQKYGTAPYTGFVSQYKGVHEYQMVFLKENILNNKESIVDYFKDISKITGVIV